MPAAPGPSRKHAALVWVPRLPVHLMAEFGYLGAGYASASLLLGGQASGPRDEGD